MLYFHNLYMKYNDGMTVASCMLCLYS